MINGVIRNTLHLEWCIHSIYRDLDRQVCNGVYMFMPYTDILYSVYSRGHANTNLERTEKWIVPMTQLNNKLQWLFHELGYRN